MSCEVHNDLLIEGVCVAHRSAKKGCCECCKKCKKFPPPSYCVHPDLHIKSNKRGRRKVHYPTQFETLLKTPSTVKLETGSSSLKPQSTVKLETGSSSLETPIETLFQRPPTLQL